jgi:hypothetical protein
VSSKEREAKLDTVSLSDYRLSDRMRYGRD